MIKKLMKNIGEYKKSTILAPSLVSIEVIMEVIIPLLMAKLIDLGIDESNMSYIIKMGAALLVAAFLSLLFGVLAGKEASVASSGFAKNLRKNMYYKVQDYSFSNIDKFSTSSIVTRLTTDVTNVQMAFQMIVRMVVRSPLLLEKHILYLRGYLEPMIN